MRMLIILILIISCNAIGKTNIVYFGGGDSDVKSDEMFDDSLKGIIAYSKKNPVKTDLFYRSKLPADVQKTDSESIKKFNQKNFDNKIEQLKSDIQNGKYSPSDQLLVYIDTHGNYDKENDKYTIYADDAEIDPKKLKELVQLAHQKNIKLGLVAQTCYSENLIDFESTNVCVISASKKDRVGFYLDGYNLIRNIEKSNGNSNLEEIFLKSRFESKNDFSPAQPVISTAVGKYVDGILQPTHNVIGDHDSAKKIVNSEICKNFSANYNKMTESIYMHDEILRELQEKDTGNSKKEIDLIKKYSQEYQMYYDKAAPVFLESKKTFCYTSSAKKSKSFCFKNSDIPDAFDAIQSGLKSCKVKYSADCDYFDPKDFDGIKKYMNSSDYKKYLQLEKSNEQNFKKMEAISDKISRTERKIYDKLYRGVSKKAGGTNACRDFKL